jgi:hypothetical protein
MQSSGYNIDVVPPIIVKIVNPVDGPGNVLSQKPEEPIENSPIKPGPIIKVPPEEALFPTTHNSRENRRIKDSPISPEEASFIGKWGEEYIHIQNVIGAYYIERNILVTLINWNNCKEESGNPHDFVVELSTGEAQFWEIKSTPSSSKYAFPISSKEFRFAMNNIENYFIIRIFSAGTDSPSYAILENLFDLIKLGKVYIEDTNMLIVRENL